MQIRRARSWLLAALALLGASELATPWAAGPSDLAPLLALGGPKVTQGSDGLIVENARFRLGPITYRVPRAELRGTSLSAAELSALLDPGSPEPIGPRIARLAAAEIVVPQLTAEQRLGEHRQTTTYRDIVLTDVGEGRIRSGRAGGASFEATGGTGTSRGGFSHLTLSDFDLAASVALPTERGGPGLAALKKLYGSFSLEGINLTDASGSNTRIARISARDLSARPTSEGWTSTMDILSAGPLPLTDAKPDERRRTLSALADLLGAFEIGSLEASGIEVLDPKNPDGAARVARIGFVGSAGSAGEFQLDGLEAGSESGRVRIGSIAVGGIALKPILDGLRAMAGGPDDISPADMRRFVPATGTLRIVGLAFDPPKTGKGSGPAGSLSVGTIEIAAAKPVEGLPSDLRLALSEVSLATGTAEDGPLKDLAGLGYDKVNLSLGAAANWQEARQEIAIRDVSVRAPGLGSATVAGTLGHVSRDVFSPDATMAVVALAGTTAQSLDLTLQDDGLFDRVIAREAGRKNRSPEELRRDYGVAAAIGVPAMLGNVAGARVLGNAIARFIARPGRLVIHLEAKDGAGIGLADLSSGADPAAILDRLEVAATAQ